MTYLLSFSLAAAIFPLAVFRLGSLRHGKSQRSHVLHGRRSDPDTLIAESIRHSLSDSPAGSLVVLGLRGYDTFRSVVGLDGSLDLRDKAKDQVLSELAHVLAPATCDVSVIDGEGGRFWLVIPSEGLESIKKIQMVVRKLSTDHSDLSIQLYGGVATWPKDGSSAENLMEVADKGFELAKSELGNTVVPALRAESDAPSSHSAAQRQRWNMLARHLLTISPFQTGELQLYGQPIVCSNTGKALSYEVLLRARDKDGQIISGGGIVQAAETLHLNTQMDQAIAGQALSLLRDTRLPGLSINITPRSLLDHAFLRSLCAAIRSTGRPDSVVIEITERSIVGDQVALRDALTRIRATGASVALDDYGSGTASLSWLARLPINVIKIDGSFVSRSAVSKNDLVAIRSTVRFAIETGMTTVAECIETDEDRQRMARIGVTKLQGYHYGHPIPLDEIIASHDACGLEQPDRRA